MKYVFIHGLGQKASSWNKVIHQLVNGKDIICPELVSLMNGKECTYKNLYDSFSEYCLETTETCSISGLSLGAVLGLNFTIEHPEKISSLILIAPQYKMPKTLLKLQNIIFHFMPHSSFQSMGFDKESVIQLMGTMADLDFSEQLKDITCPVLVLCGDKDKANQAAAKTLADHIPNGAFQLVAAAGHEVNVDAPDRLAAIIRDFYERNGSAMFIQSLSQFQQI